MKFNLNVKLIFLVSYFGILESALPITISGIHWDFHTCDGLRRYFESFGPVEQVEILGSPRGAGFIVFEDKESVRRCKAQGNEHLVDGKSLHIQTVCPFLYCFAQSHNIYFLF